MNCPFCGNDPYEYVHNGLGPEAVAIACCEWYWAWDRDGYSDEALARLREDKRIDQLEQIQELEKYYRDHPDPDNDDPIFSRFADEGDK